jgi:hypothetical protein
MNWTSRRIVASKERPGVEFVIALMTFGRRIELMRRVRDLAGMEASLLGAEIDCLYIRWGLEEIRGLTLDGAPASVDALVEGGPEELFFEALTAVKAECGLDENERKN